MISTGLMGFHPTPKRLHVRRQNCFKLVYPHPRCFKRLKLTGSLNLAHGQMFRVLRMFEALREGCSSIIS